MPGRPQTNPANSEITRMSVMVMSNAGVKISIALEGADKAVPRVFQSAPAIAGGRDASYLTF